MKILLNLDGNSIKNAAEKKKENLYEELREEDRAEINEKIEFIEDFIEKANFTELEKLGFDGSKKMEVKVVKKGDSFKISKTWRSMLGRY